MLNCILEKVLNLNNEKTDNVIDRDEYQAMVIWLKGQMKWLPVIDRYKMVVSMNMTACKDTMVMHKDMAVVHKV